MTLPQAQGSIRFLADEGCDFGVVRGLREAGFEVVAIVETAQGSEDAAVLAMAEAEARILLTEDKDFGHLFHAGTAGRAGVLLLRYPLGARSAVVADVLRVVRERGGELMGRFVVLQPGRVRLAGVPE